MIRITCMLLWIVGSIAYAEGPRFKHVDPYVNQEFINVYHDLRHKQTDDPLTVSSATITEMSVSTLTATKILPGSIQGSTSGSEPCEGCVGYHSYSVYGPISAGGDNTWTTIGAKSLTAGAWLVSANVLFTKGTGSGFYEGCVGAVSMYSGATTTDHEIPYNVQYTTAPSVATNTGVTIANFRVNIASSDDVYVKGRCAYNAGTPNYYGSIAVIRL